MQSLQNVSCCCMIVFFGLVVPCEHTDAVPSVCSSCEQTDGIAWSCTFKHCGSGDNEWKSIRCWRDLWEIKACVRACVLVLPARIFLWLQCGAHGVRHLWVRAFTALWMKKNCFLHKWPCCVSSYLQNWEMGASIWAEAPPLELSFWTWVGGTGLWDWPVARYMAWTHRMRSCSSSLANITVSPSFTALKKALPPSKPETTGQ